MTPNATYTRSATRLRVGYLTRRSEPAAPRHDEVVLDRSEILGGIDLLRANFSTRTTPLHVHSDFEIGVFTSGRRLVACNGKDYVADAGTLVAIAPGEVHAGRPVIGQPTHYRSILIPMAAIAEVAAEHMRGAALQMQSPLIRAPQLARRLVDIHLASERGTAGSDLGRELLSVVSEVIALQSRQPGVLPMSPDVVAGVARARTYIDENFSQQIRLKTLADLAGLGVFRLIRAFRTLTGLTPYAYVEQVRVAQASELLRSGMKASLVAYHTGFSDQSHLCRHFKRIRGVPPSAFQIRALRVQARA